MITAKQYNSTSHHPKILIIKKPKEHFNTLHLYLHSGWKYAFGSKKIPPLASVECNTGQIHSIEPILKTGINVLLKRKQLFILAGVGSYCPEMPVCRI